MQDLDKFKNEMNLSGKNVYVGHRYVPKIFGDWDNTQIYEPLSIVQYQGASYTSRQFVPSGVELTNEEFWVVTGNYNAQVEQYRQDVRNMENDVNNINDEVTTARNGEANLSDRLESDKQEFNEQLANNSRLKPNGENDTENINNYLRSSETNGLLLGEGVFYVDEPIQLQSNDFIQGMGSKTIIKATLDFNDGQSRGIFDLVNVENVTIKDLVLDGNEYLRETENRPSHLIMMLGSSHNTIENVQFLNSGAKRLNGYGGGPMLQMVGKDHYTERESETHELYNRVVGGSSHNNISNCTFGNSENIVRMGFGIRIVTSWESVKELDDFQYLNEKNVIDSCSFIGDWYWDTIEIAGAGCAYNNVINNNIEGRTKTAIDIDKGAQFNNVLFNTVKSLGKPDLWLNDSLMRTALINVHGQGRPSVEGLLTNNNKVIGNTVLGADDPNDPDVYKSAIGVGYGKNNVIAENIIESNRDSSGRGIFIDHKVDGLQIKDNVINNFRTGIGENNNSLTGNNLDITGNQIYANVRSLELSPLLNSDPKKITVNNNDFVSDESSITVNLGKSEHVIFTGNRISKNYEGVNIESKYGILSNNIIKDSECYSFRLKGDNNNYYLTGNVSVNHGFSAVVGVTETTNVVATGNSFTVS